MNKHLRFLLCAATMLMALAFALPTQAQIEKTPAFPGAEGWGRYVTGGRGGKVIHVTNLNDSGEGSLRAACQAKGTRTIVFDVSGTIFLKSELKLRNGNVTLAGQTAPGDGICVADWPFVISAPNVIIRYMRFRLGNTYANKQDGDGGHEGDGLGGFDGQDVMVDHCSISWSIDECCSVYGNDRMTVQWCIVSQSLRNAGHVKGAHGYGGNWGGRGATYHHNLLAHHDSRVPRLGDRPYLPGTSTPNLRDTTDLRNNVFYNWSGNGCYGGEAMHVNIVNNYYKPGPATDQRAKAHPEMVYRIAGIGVRSNSSEPAYAIWGKYYVDGNVNPDNSAVTKNNWRNGIYAQISSDNIGWNSVTRDTIKATEPLHFLRVTTHSAEDAYERVLQYAGASLHRDWLDELMVSDTRNRKATYTGTGSGDAPGIIDTPWDNKPSDADDTWSPWPTLASTAAPTDTDGDGMPDEWELANGLDPENAADGAIVTSDGYTNLEHYLNGIVAAITEAQNAGGAAAGDIQNISGTDAGTYTISNETHQDSWTFVNGLTVEDEQSKAYSNSGNYVRYIGNNKYSVKLPDGVAISTVNIKGHHRYSTRTSALIELAGTAYDETQYPFNLNGNNDGTDNEYTIALSPAVTGTLSFTFSTNTDAVITLSTTTTGILNVTPAEQPTDLNVYTLDGRRVATLDSQESTSCLPKGIYIVNHKKIVIK